MKKGLTVTLRTGDSSGWWNGSFSGLPIWNVPPCTYTIEELPTKEFGSDRYGQQGLSIPVLDGSKLPARSNRRPRANRFTKSGNLSWDGHYATFWDGKAHWYDYMD